MKNNQGKRPQQIKDSTKFVFTGIIGIMIIMFITLTGLLTIETPTDVVEVTEENLDSLEHKQPETLYDRWEGKEGKSEYGQYVPTDENILPQHQIDTITYDDTAWGDQGPCGELYIQDTIHVISEDGVNWYTIDSIKVVKDTTILKNHWKDIKNTKIKIKK